MDQHTVTIKNVSEKLFEFDYDHKKHYLQPGEMWTVESGVGDTLLKRWKRQLRAAGRGGYPTPEPLQDPNEHKQSVPDWSNSRQEFCETCGKLAEDIDDFEGHILQHDEDARKAEEPIKAEAVIVKQESVEGSPKRKAGRPRKLQVA